MAVNADRFYVARWMIAGILFGACFPLIAWWVAIAQHGALTFAELHIQQPVMWVVDLAPSVLGAVGMAIGSLHGHLQRTRASVEQVAHQIAASWTAELHRANLELVESLDERQQFYAAMSHELRTPLSAIVGYSALSNGIELQPPEMNGYMGEIYSSATALLGMVNDLLDAAKLDQHGISMTIEDLDVNGAVGELAGRLEPLAKQKGLSIRTELGVEAVARADGGRLRQILNNLVTNAIKYTDGGAITIRTAASDDGGVIIEVEDTGVGLRPDDLRSIFMPYEQTAAAVGRSDSTGLGLFICRTFANAMGAQLTAHSEGPGQGACFTLELPAATGEPAEPRIASFQQQAALSA